MGEMASNGDQAQVEQWLWRAQVENLYVEAMVLVDEAHAGFAACREAGQVAKDGLAAINLTCESLKTTTRLLHIIAWLLHQRAMLAKEPSARSDDRAARIGPEIPADWSICQSFDASLRRIVAASERLFDRIATLEKGQCFQPAKPQVHQLQAQLAARL